MELTATTCDENGNEINLRGESVEQLAEELAEYGDASLRATVYDEPGFVRGWIAATDRGGRSEAGLL